MPQNITIAIDGPAASGKGTLSKRLAEALGLAHMDTGALYRAVGLEVLKAGGNPESEEDAVKAAETLMQAIRAANAPGDVLGNPDLRKDETGTAASKIAAIQKIRDILLNLQRDFAKNPGESYKGAVLDGRDIGTVICPDADLKLYVVASDEVRAERRLKELQSKGIQVTKAAVLADMRERDARDRSRNAAPLKPADDAVVLDSSDLDADQAFEKALQIVADKGLVS